MKRFRRIETAQGEAKCLVLGLLALALVGAGGSFAEEAEAQENGDIHPRDIRGGIKYVTPVEYRLEPGDVPFDAVFELMNVTTFSYEEPMRVEFGARDKHGNFYFFVAPARRSWFDDFIVSYSRGGERRWTFFKETLSVDEKSLVADRKFLYFQATERLPGKTACVPCAFSRFHVLSLENGAHLRDVPSGLCATRRAWKKRNVLYSAAHGDRDRDISLHATSARDGKPLWSAHRLPDPGEGGMPSRLWKREMLAAFLKGKNRLFVAHPFKYTFHVYDRKGKEKRRIGPGDEWSDLPPFDYRKDIPSFLLPLETPSMILDAWELGHGVVAVERIDEEKRGVMDLWRHDGKSVIARVSLPSDGTILFAWKDRLYVAQYPGENKVIDVKWGIDVHSQDYAKDFKIREYRLKREFRR